MALLSCFGSRGCLRATGADICVSRAGRLLSWLVLAGLVLAGLAMPVAGSAEARSDDETPPSLALTDGAVDLGLTLYWGGLRMAEIDADIRFGETDYAFGLSFRSVGMLAWMVEVRSRVEAKGDRAPDGSLRPREMTTRAVFDDKKRRLRVNFDAAGAATEIDIWREEGFDPTLRDPVPADMRFAPDPVSAVVIAGMMQNGALPTGPRRFRTFDGKRALAIDIDCPAGEVTLPPSGLSAYAGPAVKCRVSGEQTAGFHKKFRKRNLKLDRSASVWLVRVPDEDIYLPVRFELATQYGAIVGHVSRIGPPPATQ